MEALIDLGLHSLGQALLHSLWQLGLIGFVVFISSKLIPNKHANARYTAAIAGFYLAPLSFALTFLYIGATSVPTFGIGIAQAADLSGLVVLVWGLGLIFNGAKLHANWRRVTALAGQPYRSPTPEISRVFERLQDHLGLPRRAGLRLSAFVSAPCTIGVFKPVVLMPLASMTNLAPDELEAILAHELAHILRRDFLHRTIQAFVECLFFYHPAVHFMSRYADQEREHACDDRAAAVIESPKSLATGLLNVGLHKAAHNKLVLNAAGPTGLEQRVSRLVTLAARENTGPHIKPRRPWIFSVFFSLILTVVIGVSSVPLFASAGSLRMDKSKLISLKDDVCLQLNTDNIYGKPLWDSGEHADIVYMHGIVYMNGNELPASTQRAVKKIFAQYGLTTATASRLRYWGNDIKLTLEHPQPEGLVQVQVFELPKGQGDMVWSTGQVGLDNKCDCTIVAHVPDGNPAAGV